MQHIGPAIILATIFGGISSMIFVILSFRLKRRILEAGKLELGPEQIKALYGGAKNPLHALKWGLLGLFSGIGLIVIQFIPFGPNSPLPWGIEISLIASAFLLYYYIASKKS